MRRKAGCCAAASDFFLVLRSKAKRCLRLIRKKERMRLPASPANFSVDRQKNKGRFALLREQKKSPQQ
jgi:hypothetical protein